MSELATSKEGGDPDYTRQIITIRKETYEALRALAFQDSKRRLKIGDVIEAFYSMALEYAPDKIHIEMELLRKNARKPGRRVQALSMLKKLNPEQLAELEQWLERQENLK